MATKNKIRKNRKIKFSEKSYVEKNFMHGKKAIIPIKLEKIEDLYMKNDYNQKIISKEVLEYVDVVAYMIPINTNIELEIHCPEIDEETQASIKKNLKNNYAMDIDDNEYDISCANKRSNMLAVVGICFLVLNVILDKYAEGFLSNIVNILWWLSIWDMIELQMENKGEKKLERLNNQQLYDCTFSFVFDIDKKLSK
ncbi:MAG: hypothetical protein HUJ68_00385 [Clostridia bacterium]|nr:hypothetical protein [Clostridia bacterium]